MSKMGEEHFDLLPEGTDTLDELLEFYDCANWIPFVHRLFWLMSVKEICGNIPADFHVSWEEIRGMTVVREELDKKSRFEIYRSEQQTKSMRRSSVSASPVPGKTMPNLKRKFTPRSR